MKLIVTPAAADYIIKQARLKSGDSVAVRGERMAKGQFAITYQPKTPDQAVAHTSRPDMTFSLSLGMNGFSPVRLRRSIIVPVN